MKQTLLNNQKENEQIAIIIYIKDGGKYGVAKDKESDLVKIYLSALLKKNDK